MRRLIVPICLGIILAAIPAPPASAQNAQPAQPPPPQATQPPSQDQDPATELQKSVNAAGNDRAALARNLQDFLRRFPDAPQKIAVYRALVDSCQQIRDDACTLDFAERLIAIDPTDAQSSMAAVTLLQQRGDDASLDRANTYVTHVIDSTRKLLSYQRPEQLSLADWEARRAQLLMSLYLVRADIQKSLHHSDAAAEDYKASYSAAANPLAAEALGDIAEAHNDLAGAIQQYLLAFVVPDNGPRKVDRRNVRRKLGNDWQQVHGSEQGLGEEILATFDRTMAQASGTNTNNNAPSTRNKDAKSVYDFVLRSLDGKPLPLAPYKGKTLVLSFWATWCAPCRELEPQLGQIAKRYQQNSDVVFLAVNLDEEESLVPGYVAREKWDLPLAYGDGLNKFLSVVALPTVIVLDRTGKTVYRTAGLPERGFSEALETALRAATAPAAAK